MLYESGVAHFVVYLLCISHEFVFTMNQRLFPVLVARASPAKPAGHAVLMSSFCRISEFRVTLHTVSYKHHYSM